MDVLAGGDNSVSSSTTNRQDDGWRGQERQKDDQAAEQMSGISMGSWLVMLKHGASLSSDRAPPGGATAVEMDVLIIQVIKDRRQPADG